MFELTYPLNIQLEITENCNHKCFYCYNGWQVFAEGNKNMSIKTASKLTDIIYNDIKPFHITVTGGEPTLNKAVLFYIFEYFSDKNVSLNINTNLTLLDKEYVDSLLHINTHFGILTSLPHFKDEKYEYITKAKDLNKFYHNLENIIDNTNIPVTVNMVVHKYNFKEVYKEGEFLFKNFNVKNFAATPIVLPSLRNKENYDLNLDEINIVLEQLVKLKKDLGLNVDTLETIPRCALSKDLLDNNSSMFSRSCSAGRSTISIDYLGNVRACAHSPINEGNLLTLSFKEIWEKLKPYRENKYVPKECLSCNDLLMCNGGCRFYGLSDINDLSKKDPRMTKPIKRSPIKVRTSFVELYEDKEYKFNDYFFIRKERDNIYTIFNGNFSNVLFVNDSLKDFILFLKDKGRFRLTDLFSQDDKINLKIKNIFRLLYEKKYIID